MVGSAASLQLMGLQKEQGHLELVDVMQPPTLVACSVKLHIAYTPDQIHVLMLAIGVGSQEIEQGGPQNALLGATREI